jgi:hypothetical protein
MSGCPFVRPALGDSSPLGAGCRNARSLLRNLGAAAHGAAENAFTFGWLHREELARGNASRKASYSALHRARAAAHKWPG